MTETWQAGNLSPVYFTAFAANATIASIIHKRTAALAQKGYLEHSTLKRIK